MDKFYLNYYNRSLDIYLQRFVKKLKLSRVDGAYIPTYIPSSDQYRGHITYHTFM